MRLPLTCLQATVLLLATSLAPPAGLAAPLPDFTVVYKVSRNGISMARSSVKLQSPDENHYRLTGKTESTGMLSMLTDAYIDETSRGQWHNKLPQPVHYQYDQPDKQKDRHISLDFDWQNFAVTGVARGKRVAVSLTDGTQDDSSLLAAVMTRMQAGAQEFELKVMHRDHLRIYTYTRKESVTLDTPIGPIKTIRVERRSKDPHKTMTLWCAPDLHYLPVRIKDRNSKKDRTLKLDLLYANIDAQGDIKALELNSESN